MTLFVLGFFIYILQLYSDYAVETPFPIGTRTFFKSLNNDDFVVFAVLTFILDWNFQRLNTMCIRRYF